MPLGWWGPVSSTEKGYVVGIEASDPSSSESMRRIDQTAKNVHSLLRLKRKADKTSTQDSFLIFNKLDSPTNQRKPNKIILTLLAKFQAD